MTESDSTYQQLRRHAGFVRRLARRLVRDENVADDIEQHTWLAALTKPPQKASKPREWLTAVAKNFLRSQERSKQRRQRREAAAARPERLEVRPGERLEREELLRQVLESVLAMEQPYRETLLLHFYEGLKPKEVAKRQGIPLETARTRIRRGVERLRQELDRKNGGERQTWALSLVALAGLEPGFLGTSWATAKEWTMRHPVEIGLTATAATVISVLTVFPGIWPEFEGPSKLEVAKGAEAAEPVAAEVPERSASRSLEPLASTAGINSPGASSPLKTRPPRRGGDPKSPTTDDEPAFVLRGRVVTPEGNPASGIPVRFFSRTGDDRLDPVESATGTDGQFELTLEEAPDRVSLWVRANEHGYADLRGDWHPEGADSLPDLGDIPLQPAGTVIVSVVDAMGQPFRYRWSVETEGAFYFSPTFTHEGRARITINAGCRDGSGTARLIGVPLGTARVVLSLPGRQWQEVEVAPGEQHIEFRYDGPDLSQRVTVSSDRSIEAEALRLVGAGSISAEEIDNNCFIFEPVPEGVYTLELEDERYLPIRKEVSPGYSTHHLRLQYRSGVRVSAHDAAAGDPVEIFEVQLRPRAGAGRLKPDTEGVIRLRPGDHELYVLADGYATKPVMIAQLAVGEVRPVTVELGRNASIRGRVIDDAGAPISQSRVVAYRPAKIDDSEESEYFPPEYERSSRQDYLRVGLAATVTDADGRFEIHDLMPGPVILRSEPFAGFGVAIDPIELAAGEDKTGVELVSAQPAELNGRLVGDASDFEHLRIWSRPASSLDWEDWTGTSVGADGSFHLGPVQPGATRICLELPPPEDGSMRLERWPSRSHVLEELVLESGENTAQFDVPTDFVSLLTIKATVEGEPMEQLRVTVEEKSPQRDRYYIGTLDTDADGLTTEQPMHAGEYDLILHPGDIGWAITRTVTIEAGSTRLIEIDVDLVDQPVRFLDATTNAPIAWTQLVIRQRVNDGNATTTHICQSNGSGEKTISLPAGTYRAFLNGESLDWDDGVELEIGASGPSPIIVRLPK